MLDRERGCETQLVDSRSQIVRYACARAWPERGSPAQGPSPSRRTASCAPSRALHLAAAARRLPRADQPAVVHARAARAASSAIDPRDRRRGDRPHPPGLGVGGPRAGPVPAHRVVVDGVHHWRAYSLTSDPARPDGCISITPKLVEEGKVSPYLVREARAGDARPASAASRATFVLPDATAGEDAVHQRRQRHHADHVHAARPRPHATSSTTSCTCTRRATPRT